MNAIKNEAVSALQSSANGIFCLIFRPCGGCAALLTRRRAPPSMTWPRRSAARAAAQPGAPLAALVLLVDVASAGLADGSSALLYRLAYAERAAAASLQPGALEPAARAAFCSRRCASAWGATGIVLSASQAAALQPDRQRLSPTLRSWRSSARFSSAR